jgi:hypothetical protein
MDKLVFIVASPLIGFVLGFPDGWSLLAFPKAVAFSG